MTVVVFAALGAAVWGKEPAWQLLLHLLNPAAAAAVELLAVVVVALVAADWLEAAPLGSTAGWSLEGFGSLAGP